MCETFTLQSNVGNSD